ELAPPLPTVGASGDNPVLALLDRRALPPEAHIATCGCQFCLQIGSVEGDRALEQVRRGPGQLAAGPSAERAGGCPPPRPGGPRVSPRPPQVRLALPFAAAPRAAPASPTPSRSSALIAFPNSV